MKFDLFIVNVEVRRQLSGVDFSPTVCSWDLSQGQAYIKCTLIGRAIFLILFAFCYCCFKTSHYVAHAGLKLKSSFLPLPREGRHQRHYVRTRLPSPAMSPFFRGHDGLLFSPHTSSPPRCRQSTERKKAN